MIWKGLVCALILTRLAPAASTWPPQLEMRVPLEPTAFPWAARLISASDLTLRFGKQLRLPCPGAVGRIGQLGVVASLSAAAIIPLEIGPKNDTLTSHTVIYG